MNKEERKEYTSDVVKKAFDVGKEIGYQEGFEAAMQLLKAEATEVLEQESSIAEYLRSLEF